MLLPTRFTFSGVLQMIAAVALLLHCSPSVCKAADFLAVQPLPGKSHWNVMRAVLMALTDRGHSVTVFTPFTDGHRDNYTEVDLSGDNRMRPATAASGFDVTYLVENFGSPSTVMANMANATRSYCAMIFEHRRMREILQRRPRFDAVVTEPFVSECVSYVAAELRVPLIYVIPPPVPTYLERSLFGHVPNPAVVPHVLSRGGALRTFGRRLANAALAVYCTVLTWRAERELRLADPRPFDLVEPVKPSVTFINTHFITEPSRSLPPNVVQIGGIHLARQAKSVVPEVSAGNIDTMMLLYKICLTYSCS